MGKYQKNGHTLSTSDKTIIAALLNSGYKAVETNKTKSYETDTETPVKKTKRGE